MGSQFVDLNSDGHLDYLSATFDGSPHVAYGSPKGFAKPVRLKDNEGRRILISSIWDYDKRKHLEQWHAMPEGNKAEERCISALAFDWDADGDYDLLLGSYENGSLYRQMNEGTKDAPKFTGRNIPVMAGERAWGLPAKMTSIRLVDWNSDGKMDLVAGSFGNTRTRQTAGGGVYLSLNSGEAGAPKFGALQALIPPASGPATEPTAPYSGLYPEVVDHDGDGDLDLIVGGYAIWTPEPRKLSDEEKALVTKMQAESSAAGKRIRELNVVRTKALRGASPKLQRSDPGYAEARKRVLAPTEEEYSALNRRMAELSRSTAEYIPTKQRKSFVWLYERL